MPHTHTHTSTQSQGHFDTWSRDRTRNLPIADSLPYNSSVHKRLEKLYEVECSNFKIEHNTYTVKRLMKLVRFYYHIFLFSTITVFSFTVLVLVFNYSNDFQLEFTLKKRKMAENY